MSTQLSPSPSNPQWPLAHAIGRRNAVNRANSNAQFIDLTADNVSESRVQHPSTLPTQSIEIVEIGDSDDDNDHNNNRNQSAHSTTTTATTTTTTSRTNVNSSATIVLNDEDDDVLFVSSSNPLAPELAQASSSSSGSRINRRPSSILASSSSAAAGSSSTTAATAPIAGRMPSASAAFTPPLFNPPSRAESSFWTSASTAGHGRHWSVLDFINGRLGSQIRTNTSAASATATAEAGAGTRAAAAAPAATRSTPTATGNLFDWHSQNFRPAASRGAEGDRQRMETMSRINEINQARLLQRSEIRQAEQRLMEIQAQHTAFLQDQLEAAYFRQQTNEPRHTGGGNAGQRAEGGGGLEYHVHTNQFNGLRYVVPVNGASASTARVAEPPAEPKDDYAPVTRPGYTRILTEASKIGCPGCQLDFGHDGKPTVLWFISGCGHVICKDCAEGLFLVRKPIKASKSSSKGKGVSKRGSSKKPTSALAKDKGKKSGLNGSSVSSILTQTVAAIRSSLKTSEMGIEEETADKVDGGMDAADSTAAHAATNEAESSEVQYEFVKRATSKCPACNKTIKRVSVRQLYI